MAIKLPKTHLALSPMSPSTELQVCTSTHCFSTSALETQTFSCVHSDCFTNWAGSPPITLGLLTQLAVFRRESLAVGNAMLQWQMLGHPSETGAYGKMLPLRYWGCLCLDKEEEAWLLWYWFSMLTFTPCRHRWKHPPSLWLWTLRLYVFFTIV